MEGRVVLHSDLNNCYASIECMLHGTIETAEEFKQVLDWCGTYISS